MRLNKEIKAQILNNAIKKSPIIAEAELLIAERADIAEKLRGQFISEELENEIDSIHQRLNQLEKETHVSLLIGYSKDYEIMVNINGLRLDLSFSGYHYHISRSILGIYNETEVKKTISRGHRYVVIDDCGIMENERKCDELFERYNSLKVQVNAILSKCNTDNQLLKLWPESSELIPKEQVVSSKEIMVKTDELNAMLGLPTGDL